jgi:DNA-binding XRE family transcriptional regulator
MNRLKEIRNLRYYSQAEMAKATGITEATLVALEKGRQHPQYATVRKLAEFLKVEPSELNLI